MIVDHVRLRRRRYLLLRIADEITLDIGRFLRGEVVAGRAAKCWVLCPVTGKTVPVTAEELAAVMAEPAERWRESPELLGMEEEAKTRLVDLARRGILISDPPFEGWEELASGEQVLEQTQWLDLAAVYHAHSRWEGVSGVESVPRNDRAAQSPSL